jgi:hypothetical protein
MRMFGVLNLNSRADSFCFSIGVRNDNDKSMRLSMVAGLRVTVCDNMLFAGDFKPVLRNHTKAMELTDLIAVGVEKIQRNFDPMARQVEEWKAHALSDAIAKSVIYDACLTEKLFPRKDPFIGSGTTALTARRWDRNFVGIELNPTYIDQAKERLAMEVSC